MLNQSNQTTLEMRLSLYLHDISDKDKQFNLNLIKYWLSDSDFSDIEPEEDIAYTFSTIFRVIEGENNPENKTKVFKEWFSLLGLYFLNIDDNPYFSERRRLDFASFCLFLVENLVGGHATAAKLGQAAYRKSLSKKGTDKRHKHSRDLKRKAIEEYKAASNLLLNEGAKITYESIARVIWRKIEKFNLSTDGRTAIDPTKDPIGRIVSWLSEAADEGKIVHPRDLRKK